MVLFGFHRLADLSGDACLERLDHRLHVADAAVAVEDRHHGALDQALDDLLVLALFDGFELDLALQRWHHERQVGDAGDDLVLAKTNRTPHCVRQHRLVVGDRSADGDAGALRHVRRTSCQARDLRNDFRHEVGHDHREVVTFEVSALLLHDRDFVLDRSRVVRPEL